MNQAEQWRQLDKRIRQLETAERPAIACRVYNDANISIPDAADTALTFNTERSDPAGMHSTSTNTSRITFALGGWYYVFGNVRFDTNATGQRSVYIRLGGGTIIASQRAVSASASVYTHLSLSTVYYFAATNYVELVVYQNSGDALNILAAGNYAPEFAAIRLP